MDQYMIFFIILLISIILLRIARPSKGVIGEKRISNILNKLNQEEYYVFNDLILKSNNVTSQIDHLIISAYGIFVIETKNFSGWIHGSEKSEYWMQNIYKRKYKFRNPIKQNWSHIYALKQNLKDYNNIIYYPIVVFVGAAELKNVHTTSPVIYHYDLLDKIYNLSNSTVLSKEQLSKVISTIENNEIEDKNIKKEHIRDIKSNIQNINKSEKNKVCPRCNNNLILRKGKYGNFYGCINYPKCRYTMNK